MGQLSGIHAHPEQPGHLTQGAGETEDAIRLYQRALAILERRVEPDHPNLLACRTNYSALLRRTGSRT